MKTKTKSQLKSRVIEYTIVGGVWGLMSSLTIFFDKVYSYLIYSSTGKLIHFTIFLPEAINSNFFPLIKLVRILLNMPTLAEPSYGENYLLFGIGSAFSSAAINGLAYIIAMVGIVFIYFLINALWGILLFNLIGFTVNKLKKELNEIQY